MTRGVARNGKQSGLPAYCVKKQGAGKNPRYYFQRKHYRVPLPPPEDPGFQEAYQRAYDAMPSAAHLAEAVMFMSLPIPPSEVEKYFAARQNGARCRARQSGREYTLPKGWAAGQYLRQEGKCAISGMTMQPSTGRQDFFSPSIDRIDSSVGYTPENCHLVTFGVNVAKGTVSLGDFIRMCRLVLDQARRTERELNKNVVPLFEMGFSGSNKINTLDQYRAARPELPQTS